MIISSIPFQNLDVLEPLCQILTFGSSLENPLRMLATTKSSSTGDELPLLPKNLHKKCKFLTTRNDRDLWP